MLCIENYMSRGYFVQSQRGCYHIYYSLQMTGGFGVSYFLLILIVADGEVAESLPVTCLEADTAETAWNVYSKGAFERQRSIVS